MCGERRHRGWLSPSSSPAFRSPPSGRCFPGTSASGASPRVFPQEGEAVWRVTEHAWISVDAERAGKALLTILVDDLDEQIAQLAARGFPVGPIEVVGESVRTVATADPEGNRITFGQPPP